jgi:glycerol-3-phosphate dehydrogenase
MLWQIAPKTFSWHPHNPPQTGYRGPVFRRDESLRRLAGEQFDVLVVGGGVTGCGVALDAASRGLRTALVEARDFASGTSSKSSKMVHGGLRYLQQHDYLLVYEALHERQRLLRNAPHLVRPLPFLVPLFGKDGVVSKSLAQAYAVALWTYDLTGGLRIGRRHKRVTAADSLAHFPVLRTDRLVTAFLYWDAQADDARLTLALARTAAAYGAVLANYAPVESLIKEQGRVRGARLADGAQVRAQVVVNATGVWAEQLAADSVSIRPAKGIHVAVRSDKLPCDYASVLAVPGDRRSVFVVPWAADEATSTSGPGRYTYVGTTDTDYDGPLDDPQCTPDDVDYLLAAVNAWTSAGLTPADVTGSWAGLRPLISDARSARTADLSRRHQVVVSDAGLVTVTGGKLTTYRKMAADTVDAAAKLLDAGRRIPRSRTKRLRLIGGDDRAAPNDAVGLTAAQSSHLAGRYGSEAAEIIDLCRRDPSLAEPLVAGLPYLKAEAIYAARQEMAHTLSDVLARRTRAAILNRDATIAAAPAVAALLAPELVWDGAEQARQVAALAAEIHGEARPIRPVA